MRISYKDFEKRIGANMAKLRNFFAMLSRMKYINRWGLMRNTITENIAEHSLDVAVIAHGLAVIGNTYFGKQLNEDRIAVLAMYHDTTEIITGDLPTPIKYFAPEIKIAYKSVEAAAGNSLLHALPRELRPAYKDIILESEEDKELWKYVKAADKLSAYIKCVEEKRLLSATKLFLISMRKAKLCRKPYCQESWLWKAKNIWFHIIQAPGL